LGLERVGHVYAKLIGEANKPFTITVAGTNGKGSTATFLEHILIAAGYQVGCYRSPHLVHYNERVCLQGEPVSDGELCAAFQKIDQARASTSLSYFEFGTLAALQIFSQENVDIQILEVGLGGRLDAINIVDADIAIITSIAIDHCDWLGDSRSDIGFEKAGIFRRLKPAISGEPELPDSVVQHAASIGAVFKRINRDFSYQPSDSHWSWNSKQRQVDQLPMPGLQGKRQLRNAATALAAIDSLPESLIVDDEAIREGLTTARLPGRIQWLDRQQTVLLDVSHNPESAKVLAEYLNKRAAKGSVFALFSFMGDKDIEAILAEMQSVVDHWYWIPLDDVPRAANKEQIENAFSERTLQKPVTYLSNIEKGLAEVAKTREKDDCIVIFGSFYLASKVVNLLDGQGILPEALLPQV
jgi:dihydrofolate synthase/folylpolyglutamate synthase